MSRSGGSPLAPNSLKQLLDAGRPAVGCLLAFDAPWLIEILGLVGFDHVVIDVEHEPLDGSAIAGLIRAADAVQVPAIVRAPCDERLSSYLSLGPCGVQVPDLRSREHAEMVVERVRFAPRGRRTYYSQTRAADYGIGINEPAWAGDADARLLLIGMLEDVRVLDDLDGILEVDGFDAFHFGTFDLAQSMGFPPAAELDATIEAAARRCRAAGRHVSVGAVAPWSTSSVAYWFERGARLFTVASAWAVTDAMGAVHAAVQEQLPEELRRRTGRIGSNPYLQPKPRS